MPSRRPLLAILRRQIGRMTDAERTREIGLARLYASRWECRRGALAAAIWRGWILRAAMLRAAGRIAEQRHASTRSNRPHPLEQPGGYSLIKARKARARV